MWGSSARRSLRCFGQEPLRARSRVPPLGGGGTQNTPAFPPARREGNGGFTAAAAVPAPPLHQTRPSVVRGVRPQPGTGLTSAGVSYLHTYLIPL